ncbi:MAG: putative bifunctional diguanylate cyclase/phosphodiesterase [Rubrobacteraceae bacterium]
MERVLKVSSINPDLRRKGRVLAVMLLGMTAAMLTLALYNTVRSDEQYYVTNGLIVFSLVAIFLANRFGFVYTAGLCTIALATAGPFLLIGDQLKSSYLAMPLPILIASSLIAPWTGFVVAVFLIAGAALFGIFSPSLLILFIVAIISYLFADSLDRAYRESRHRALHDPLTDLPNRDLFLDRLEHAADRMERTSKFMAVLFMDVDNFKIINDSLGHEVGDKLLIRVGNRIRSCVRPEDTVARLGGDEFTVLLENLADVSGAIDVAERIAERLRKPFDLSGREISVELSTGIALSGPGDTRPVDLLRDADVAMYQAKKANAEYEVFRTSMHAEALGRLELEGELRHAIENEDFEIYYQPKVSFRSGRIVEVEALVRWGSSRRSLVMPSEFIPVAEETGLIVPIGKQVLEEACRQVKEWQVHHGIAFAVKMCVNLSVRQFQHHNLIADIIHVLQETGLRSETLQLEITESLVMQDEQHAIDILRKLKTLGIQLSIDDFGKGYSSLSYLRDLPVDSLKIDRSFVQGIDREAADAAIVRSVIGLAHTLNLEVTAEGVENAQQSSLLQEMGCDLAQGYFFFKPLPGEEVGRLLAEQVSL